MASNIGEETGWTFNPGFPIPGIDSSLNLYTNLAFQKAFYEHHSVVEFSPENLLFLAKMYELNKKLQEGTLTVEEIQAVVDEFIRLAPSFTPGVVVESPVGRYQVNVSQQNAKTIIDNFDAISKSKKYHDENQVLTKEDASVLKESFQPAITEIESVVMKDPYQRFTKTPAYQTLVQTERAAEADKVAREQAKKAAAAKADAKAGAKAAKVALKGSKLSKFDTLRRQEQQQQDKIDLEFLAKATPKLVEKMYPKDKHPEKQTLYNNLKSIQDNKLVVDELLDNMRLVLKEEQNAELFKKIREAKTHLDKINNLCRQETTKEGQKEIEKLIDGYVNKYAHVITKAVQTSESQKKANEQAASVPETKSDVPVNAHLSTGNALQSQQAGEGPVSPVLQLSGRARSIAVAEKPKDELKSDLKADVKIAQTPSTEQKPPKPPRRNR